MASTPIVFISYSQVDREWKDRLFKHLHVVERQGLIEVADDSRIAAGEDWRKAVGDTIQQAGVAVVLVSADYLASEFIQHEEIPRLLERRQREGLRIIPVIIRACDWQSVEWLAKVKAIPRDGVPLALRRKEDIEDQLAAVAREVRAALSIVVKAEERREVQARVEGTAAEYITTSLDELRAREKADRRLALVWYSLGYASLMLGVVVSAWRVTRLGTLQGGWLALVEFAVLGLVTIALLLALAKYAFSLGKSFMVEALRHADRTHAISFGHFYLKAFGAQADWNNVKEALQNWNIDRGSSSFMSQEPAQFDPKLLETATEIAKVLASHVESKK